MPRFFQGNKTSNFFAGHMLSFSYSQALVDQKIQITEKFERVSSRLYETQLSVDQIGIKANGYH